MEVEEIMRKGIEKALSNTCEFCRRNGTPSGKLTEAQLEELKGFKEYYEELPSPRGGKNKITSVYNAVYCVRRFGLFLKEMGVESFKVAKKEDILAYFKSMNDQSDTTQSRAKVGIRSFYKWVYGVTEKYKFPEVVDDKRLVPNTTRNKKKPQDLLTNDEIRKMLDVSSSYRQKAIIMLSLGEGGMRAGEIVSLNISSLEFDEKGVKVWVEKSKSKERFVRLISSEPILREYVNKEYKLDKSTPSNPLFYTIAGSLLDARIRRTALTELLKRIAKKVGIQKNVYCHLGRSINISQLTKKGMSAEISAKRFGITPTTLRNVYLTIDDKDVDEVYLKIEGNLSDDELRKIRKEEKQLEIRICPRCQERYPDQPNMWKHPSTASYCNCGFILDPILAEKKAQSEMEMEYKLHKFMSVGEIQKLFKSIEKIKLEIKGLKDSSRENGIY